MQLSNKQLRVILRAIHLVGMPVLGAFLYLPWGETWQAEFVMQAIVFPIFIITGVMMWQMPLISRLRRERKNT